MQKWFVLKVNVSIGRKLFLALLILGLSTMFVLKGLMSGETFAFLVSALFGFVAGAVSYDKMTVRKSGGNDE